MLASAVRPRATWRFPKITWPLVLQLLFVALVTFALAYPVLSGRNVQRDHMIAIVDASGSMTTRNVDDESDRFETALSALLSDLDRARAHVETRSVIVASAHAIPLVLRAEGIDLSHLAPLAQVTHGAADWSKARELVQAVLAPGESATIRVYTDRDGRAGAMSYLSDLVPDEDLRVFDFGTGSGVNAYFSAVSVTGTDEANTVVVAGAAALAGGEDEIPNTVRVQMYYESAETDGSLLWWDEPVMVTGGVAEFSAELEFPGPGLIELRLPDDAVEFDNRYFAHNHDQSVPRALYVGSIDGPFVRALGSVDGLELFLSDGLPEDSAFYDLVVVDSVQVPRHPGANTLWLGDAHVAEDASPSDVDATRASAWDEDHPLSESVDWSAIRFSHVYESTRSNGGDVLLEASGVPVVQARTTLAGREVHIAFPPMESNWPDQASFPAFVANLIQWISGTTTQGSVFCMVGEPCQLPISTLADEGAMIRLGDSVGHDMTLPVVIDPLSTRAHELWFLPGGDEWFVPTHVDRVSLRAGQELIINPRLGGGESLIEDGSAERGDTRRVADDVSGVPPIWVLLVIAALVIAVIEVIVAGTGIDRFLQANALARDHPLSNRHWAILGLRVVTICFLVLALFGLDIPVPTSSHRLIVVSDDPRLYPEGSRERMYEVRRRAHAEGTAQGDRITWVDISNGPQLVYQASESESPSVPTEHGFPVADLESSLRLAGGLLSWRDGRVLIIHGGFQTQGNAVRSLSGVPTSLAPVDVVMAFPSTPPNEVVVEAIHLPATLYEGDSVVLQAILYSQSGGREEVDVMMNGELLAEAAVDLVAGRTRVDIPLPDAQEGDHVYELVVTSAKDYLPENDRDGAFVSVRPMPAVAIFTSEPRSAEPFARALELQDVSSRILPPHRAPFTPEGWVGFDAVVLMNVPALDLDTKQQEALEVWVKDHGGGLMILGGENAFGPGGYYETALERISPLSARVPREAPKVALLFVLDRSGSMQQRVGDVSRLEIAKEATLAAIDLLHEESLASIVAFDTEATVLAPMQSVQNRHVFREHLQGLVPGGGTSLYPALVEALEEFADVDAMARHMVVLTDGLSQPGDFETVLKSITAEGISASTVAIGQGADTVRLQEIARLGRGAFHSTTDFRALPSILSQEALLLSGTPVEEGAATPAWADRSAPFVAGLPDMWPELDGYVLTTAKNRADVHMTVGDDAPLLASWRPGVGRVIGFASHGAGPFTRRWIQFDAYPRLWAQAVRWILPSTHGPGVHVDLRRSGDVVQVHALAISEDGQMQSGLDLSAEVEDPSGALHAQLELSEVSPGEFTSSFEAVSPGIYRVSVHSDEDSSVSMSGGESSIYVGYPARFRVSDLEPDLMEGIANVTGGRILLGDEELTPGTGIWWRWVDARPWILLTALCLFFGDLSIRYTSTRGSLLRWWRMLWRSKSRIPQE